MDDHGLAGPIVMDATVAQHDGCRFGQTLPFGPRRVLVEDTYFSDGADLASDTVRERALEYPTTLSVILTIRLALYWRFKRARWL